MTLGSFHSFRIMSTIGLALALGAPTHAQSPNVARWATAQQRVASADDNQRVSIAAFLSFRNLDALKDLIAAQSTPGNAQYGNYLTPDQFRSRFAPNAADVARVQQALRQLGLRVDYTPTSGLFVQASGTVAQVKAAFSVSQEIYAYKGKLLRANAEPPRLPAAMAGIVTYIAGLDDTVLLRKPNHIRLTEGAASAVQSSASPNAPPTPQTGIPSSVCSTYWGDHSATLATAAGPYPQTLPWLMCGYTPQQLRAAYGSDQVTEDGSGVTVGIVDAFASPTIVFDANTYSHNHGLPPLSHHNFVQLVPPGVYNQQETAQCDPQGWYPEESLDIESVHSMAPGANIVFAADTCTDPVNMPLYNFIDGEAGVSVNIITNSYSYGGEALPADFINAENQYFLQAASEGISVLFSSGDSGDLVAFNGYASGSWDATSPYVTAVGGTSLALLNSRGEKREWGWGTYRALLNNATVSPDGTSIATTGPALPFTFYSGSGGGPSVIMAQPFYQYLDVPYQFANFTTLADGSVVSLGGAFRVTPDISMVGDPYTGFVYGETFTTAGNPINDAGCIPLTSTTEYCEGGIGGTSLSSPLFAGVLALVDQARFRNHRPPVGFVNPALYFLRTVDAGSEGPIVDVTPPRSPTAVLRGYLGSPNKVRVVTMNSTLNPNYTPGAWDQPQVIEGADTSYLTGFGYDEVTGLGTPYVPALIEAFSIF